MSSEVVEEIMPLAELALAIVVVLTQEDLAPSLGLRFEVFNVLKS